MLIAKHFQDQSFYHLLSAMQQTSSPQGSALCLAHSTQWSAWRWLKFYYFSFFLSNWTTFEIFVVDFARGSVCFRHAKFVPKTKGNDVSHWVPSGETISWRTRINWLYVMNLSLKGFRTTSKIWRKCCKASSIVFFLLRDIIQKRNTHTLTLQ